MLTLKVIRLEQAGIPMYLTSLTVKQIKDLFANGQLIVDAYEPSNPSGYQRGIDETRATEISEFLSSNIIVLPALLPGSVILNCRKPKTIHYDEAHMQLIIHDNAAFHVVDGQHRLTALQKTKVSNYEIPVTIVQGLDIAQEAGQFLTINTKQKRVRPDLQLRILYNQDRKNTRRLIDILGVENWKLEALTLCIALNDKNESPWRNMILRPGEKRNGKWKPITEANFVDSLNFFCNRQSPIKTISIENKEAFLIQYWDEVRKIYPTGFTEVDGPDYTLARGLGAGIFNTMAPAIYGIVSAFEDELPSFLSPLKRRVPLEDWRRPRGKIARMGSSQSAYRTTAEDFLKIIAPSLSYIDSAAYQRLVRRAKAKAHIKTLQKASGLLSPLNLRAAADLRDVDWNLKGCYVLVRINNSEARVYVGKSNIAKKRLKQHRRYDLYAVRACASDREMEDLEMALFHLVKSKQRANDNHPAPADSCPYCGN